MVKCAQPLVIIRADCPDMNRAAIMQLQWAFEACNSTRDLGDWLLDIGAFECIANVDMGLPQHRLYNNTASRSTN